jgi:hypothetical protein
LVAETIRGDGPARRWTPTGPDPVADLVAAQVQGEVAEEPSGSSACSPGRGRGAILGDGLACSPAIVVFPPRPGAFRGWLSVNAGHRRGLVPLLAAGSCISTHTPIEAQIRLSFLLRLCVVDPVPGIDTNELAAQSPASSTTT